MSFKFFCILICSFLSKLFSSNLTAQPIDLSTQGWKFQQGDSMAWASPQYNDNNWLPIAVGMPWQAILGTEYTGMAWYRRTIVVPDELKKTARKEGALMLRLGMINDADETYFNGIKIGVSGQFEPDNLSAWNVPRYYWVPFNLIKWGEPNVIAVRVNAWGSGGGMTGGDYILEAVTWKNKFKILVANGHQNNAYPLNEPVVIKTQLANNSDQKLEGVLTCTILSFAGKTLQTGSHEVSILRGRVAKAEDFIFHIPDMGFYTAVLTFKDKKGLSVKETIGFAVAPENVRSEPTRPPDFVDYWDKTRQTLADIAPQFKMTPLPKWSTSKVDMFEVDMQSLDNIRIRGYYAQPKGKTNVPAVLNLQGYSSIMQPFEMDTNVAAFFLNIRGHGNSRDDVNPGFPGFLLRGLDNKEQYIYKGAYMDCVRAVDFLCSRAEVDTARIAVSGGSQGGALSIAAASLDKRVKLCMPDMPFLSDFRNYFKLVDWPFNEFKSYVFQTGRTWDEVYNVLDYIDIKNLAPDVTCPVIMAVGLLDDICPAAINFAAFNNIASKDKTYFLYPQSGHSIPAEHYGLKMKWLYKHFEMTP